MSYRREEIVRRGPEPTLEKPVTAEILSSIRLHPAMDEASQPPQKSPPIALEWKTLVEAIDITDKLVEVACIRFSAVCDPKIDLEALAEDKEPLRRSDMADAIAFETNRLRKISSKLACLTERCQL